MKGLIAGARDCLRDSGKTGLGHARGRRLIRIIFLCTVLVLPVFSVFQFAAGRLYLATAELIISAVALCGIYYIGRVRNARLWTIGYLIGAFGFFAYIAVKPGASPTGFVWLYLAPIISYLLLGRLLGFIITAPFMVAVATYACIRVGPPGLAQDWIDLMNPILCGAMIMLFVHLYETSRAEYQSKLSVLARTDSLTGLANRNSFQSALARTVTDSERRQARFALALIDVDHFKRINDTYGHDAGDHVLQGIAQCFGERLRSTDVVGRLGGEEFGLILRDVDANDACRLTNELRATIAGRTVDYGGHRLQVTATFGIAYWPDDARAANDLYQEADRRLYAGKHMGRNVIVSDAAPGHAAAHQAQHGGVQPE